MTTQERKKLLAEIVEHLVSEQNSAIENDAKAGYDFEQKQLQEQWVEGFGYAIDIVKGYVK